MAKTGKDVIVWVGTYKDFRLGKVPAPQGVKELTVNVSVGGGGLHFYGKIEDVLYP